MFLAILCNNKNEKEWERKETLWNIDNNKSHVHDVPKNGWHNNDQGCISFYRLIQAPSVYHFLHKVTSRARSSAFVASKRRSTKMYNAGCPYELSITIILWRSAFNTSRSSSVIYQVHVNKWGTRVALTDDGTVTLLIGLKNRDNFQGLENRDNFEASKTPTWYRRANLKI